MNILIVHNYYKIPGGEDIVVRDEMAMLNKRNYIGFEKSKEYWEKSLGRIGKYEGKTVEELKTVEITDDDGDIDNVQLATESDKEFNGKMAILIDFKNQLEEYANTMSLSILKNLKLTFVSKANDNRVEEVLRKRGLSGYTKEEQTVEEVVNETETSEVEKVCSPKETYVAPIVKDIIEYNKETFVKDCAVKSDGARFKLKPIRLVSSVTEPEISETVKRKRGRPKGSKNKKNKETQNNEPNNTKNI